MISYVFQSGQSPSKKGSSLKGKNLLLRSKFFLLRVDPIQKEGIMKMQKLFPMKVFPFALIHLVTFFYDEVMYIMW